MMTTLTHTIAMLGEEDADMTTPLSDFWDGLNLSRPLGSARWMRLSAPDGRISLDAGDLDAIAGVEDYAGWTVGPSMGASPALGCEDRWPIFDADGDMIAELRDDPVGYTFHECA